jgi:hypothetical protein
MKALFYGLTVLLGALALLKILRFGELIIFGGIAAANFFQLALAVLFLLGAWKCLQRARGS